MEILGEDLGEDIEGLLSNYLMADYESGARFWYNEKDENGMSTLNQGVVLEKYLDGDSETIRMLKRGVTDDELLREIKNNIESELSDIRNDNGDDVIGKIRYEVCENRLEELSKFSIDDWIHRNCDWINDHLDECSYDEKRSLIYLHYAYLNYKKQKQCLYCGESDQIKEAYRNVLDKQSVLHTYGLLEINDDVQLQVINPPRIYDKRINKTFFVKNVPLEFLREIKSLMERKLIGSFSVRLKNIPALNGNIQRQHVFAEMERGREFELSDLGNHSVSRLYQKHRYDDCLWVNIEPHDITFEELYEDLSYYKGTVVTQVIHVEYELVDAAYLITHLDHEYVFYSAEDYETRKKKPGQKGEALPRVKSFLIADARIPLEYRVPLQENNCGKCEIKDERFLCYVLETYFKHKELIVEYFKRLLEEACKDKE